VALLLKRKLRDLRKIGPPPNPAIPAIPAVGLGICKNRAAKKSNVHVLLFGRKESEIVIEKFEIISTEKVSANGE